MSQETQALDKQVELTRAYQAVFKGPDGELVLADLLRLAGLLVDRTPEPYALAIAEGRAQVGRRIIRMMALNEMELMRRKKGATDD